MVQIFEPRKTFGEIIGQNLGSGLGEGVSNASNFATEIAKQKALYSLIQDRESRLANAGGKVNYNKSGSNNFYNDDKKLIGNEKLSSKSNPNFQEESMGFGNAPQSETKGIKRKLYTPDEIKSEGKRIAFEKTQAGIPTSPEEGMLIVNKLDADNKAYNQEVDKDRAERINSQTRYGELAEEKLSKLFENPTDEQRALFRRKGEEASNKFSSEAEINRELSAEARKFKNTIANIQKSIEPPRNFTKLKQHLLGTYRSPEKAREDIRLKLKPLLDEGLYDTARNLLSEKGYHPEERESIITDLGENSKKILNQFPSMKSRQPRPEALKQGIVSYPRQISEDQREKFNENIRNVLNSDPSTNLILLRKAYEDKGVNWEEVKDEINKLVKNGEVKLNDDQFSQLDILDEPPLDNLDKILHGLGFIGR